MSTIKVMISSTISDLVGDRDAVAKVLQRYNFVEIMGAGRQQRVAVAGSSHLATIKMAENCDLYIIIMSGRYGYEIKEDLSATQAEFNAAYKDDPTKILVFVKDVVEIESKQKVFIESATNYYNGYFRIAYNHTHELQEHIENSFIEWLTDRASIGKELNYFDHFIRIAVQRKPRADARVFYSIEPKQIEIRYEFNDKTHVIHFSREKILKDFWGSVSEIEHAFIEWTR